ncbi:MAG TPA: hypothetical protein PKD45_03730 [Flavobacteriales bacterium]|nr:hypothetical protein [Flavobacteriales bacterium]
MDDPLFPLYRRSINGLNWYRIDSPTAVTEVQRVGSRHVVHRLEAIAYPEQVRVLSLIDMHDGHVEECPAEEVEELIDRSGRQG